ncbi:MAG: efflux RND transporter permease subunit [Chitinispirillaceae bacterium]|nr:efflux RND transporter permease subunit [Chitinispirillaceae bacterium]
MSNSFISLPIRRPVLTTVIYTIVIIIGIFSLTRLPIDLMPEITYPTITVITSYENAGPQEVEELITRQIESALAAVQGIEELTSTSSEGTSRVRATFIWGTDLDVAVNDIRDRIDRVLGRLPEDVERPLIRKFDVSAFPILMLGIASELDPADVQQLIEDQVQYRIERVEGVASVDMRGGSKREVHVKLKPAALEALQISPDMIVNTLKQENRNIPAGIVDDGNKEVIVRTFAEYGSSDDVKNAIIAVKNGVPITIGDVAEVSDGLEEITSIVRINSKPGFRLAVSKQSGVNTVQAAAGVLREIKNINLDIPQIHIAPLMDTSVYIKNAIMSVAISLLLGGAIAIIILLIFLRNISSTLIIATVIPVSIIASFSLIYFGGLTLNMMTFGGLALGIGMLVDNAIVVLDNIFHHREQGGKPADCATRGVSEVASAVVASTLTTLVVFFPVIFIRGMSGIMFQQLAFVVSFSLTCSLIAALTLIPLLTSKFLKISPPDKKRSGFFSTLFKYSEKVYLSIEDKYGRLLNQALKHRLPVIIISFSLLVVSILMIPLIGMELMPSSDENEVRVNLEMEVGTKLELMDSATAIVEKIIEREVPEATYMLSSIGNSGWRSTGSHSAEIRVSLVSKSERKRSTTQIATMLRKKLIAIPGTTIRVREGQGLFIMRMGSSDAQTIGIEIRGYDLESGQKLANELSGIVADIKGITDTKVSREAGMPEFTITINRKKAADLGLTASQIGSAVQIAMGGTQASSIRRDGKEYAIIVRLPEEQRTSINQLNNLTIVNKAGLTIPLQSVASINGASGPVQIERRDRERIVTVNASYSGRDLGSIVNDIRDAVHNVTVPAQFSIVIRGDYEEQQKAQNELMFGLFLAIVLIYLVMAGQFESFKDPFIILFSIPMALVGVVTILYLTGTPFSMQAFLGCIVLAGIAVNNAIILIDYMNKLRREQHVELFEAIRAAGTRRLRPILMSTSTTALGLLPLSLALGEGGEAQAPMARVVIGGLFSSTFITLFLIPVIYSLVEEHRHRKRSKKQADTTMQLAGKLTLFVLFVVSMTAPASVAAQSSASDTLQLSLQDVLTKAAQNNPTIRIDKIDLAIAEKYVNELKFRYEPSFSASFGQSRKLIDGESSPPDYQGSVKITESLPTGTGLSVSASAEPSYNLRIPSVNAGYRNQLDLSVTQALLANNSVKVNLVPIKKASIDVSMRNEELTAVTQNLLADVQNAYWDLYLAQKQVEIHTRSMQLAERLLFESTQRLNVGKAAPLDLVSARAEVATRKKNLIDARAALQKTQFRLAYLTSDTLFSADRPLLLTDTPVSPSAPDSIHQHLQAAQKFRPDFRLANNLLEKGELDIIQTRNGLLPKLDLFISLSGTAYANSFSESFKPDTSTRAKILTAGLSLSLPVTNGIARIKHQRTLLTRDQLKHSISNLKNLIQLDVRAAWVEVNRTISQIDAATEARKLQEEKLAAEQTKLDNGKSTDYIVLQVQRDLIGAQLDEARAGVAYCTAITNLYLKDGTLLERLGIQSR